MYIKLFTNLETITIIQLKYSTKTKSYIKNIMAGITQKELKKPYFLCGPFCKRKYQK